MNPRVAQLGPRASLLLGMLLSAPLTACELYDRVDAASSLDLDAIDGGSTRLMIRSILDGGTMEVLAQLMRLEAAGVVCRLGDVNYDQCLWWAIEPSAWPPSS